MKNKELKYIACSVDENYFEHLFVMLFSFFKKNYKGKFKVFILTSDLSINKQKMLNVFFSLNKNTYEIIKLDSKILQDVAILSGHITLAAYYRIFLTKLIPSSINKILYLDIDIIINSDLSNLWNLNIDNFSHLGVEDIGLTKKLKSELLNTENSLYFNSGMLFINLDWWRKFSLLDKCLLFLKKHPEKIIFHDQDVLNVILKDKWINLPIGYNAQESLFRQDMQLYKHKEYLEAYYNPKIIHFTGGGEHSKPWYNACKNELRNEYVYYAYKLDKSVKEKYFIWFAGKKFNLNDVTINFVFIQRFIRKIKYLNFKFSHFLT